MKEKKRKCNCKQNIKTKDFIEKTYEKTNGENSFLTWLTK